MPSPIGHALAGMAAAWIADLVPGSRAWRTAPPSASWYLRAGGGLTIGCAVAAAAPDLDLLIHQHRTFTHSIGATIAVGVLAGAMAARRSRPVVRVALMCATAYGTHVLLDWLGTDNAPPYGIQALWPLSTGWYLSHLDVFGPTERRAILGAHAIRQNTTTVLREIAILGPAVWGIWLVRVKALAGLSTEQARGDHPPE